jgi:hypothetical protein
MDEAIDYIYDGNGQLIPAVLREETHGGRQLHGDHVVADGLAYLAMKEMPQQSSEPRRPPKGSYADRRERSNRRRRGRDPWRT